MTAIVNQTLPLRLAFPSRFARYWRENPPLMISGLIMLAALAVVLNARRRFGRADA